MKSDSGDLWPWIDQDDEETWLDMTLLKMMTNTKINTKPWQRYDMVCELVWNFWHFAQLKPWIHATHCDMKTIKSEAEEKSMPLISKISTENLQAYGHYFDLTIVNNDIDETIRWNSTELIISIHIDKNQQNSADPKLIIIIVQNPWESSWKDQRNPSMGPNLMGLLTLRIRLDIPGHNL